MVRLCFLLLVLMVRLLPAQPIFFDGSAASGIGHPGRNFGVAFKSFEHCQMLHLQASKRPQKS
jgi:hypothetical protein